MREKKYEEIRSIALTIKQLAVRDMKPKALIEAVSERHPKASKKDVARAAFLSVILSAEFDPEHTKELHDLAVDTREEAENETLDR